MRSPAEYSGEMLAPPGYEQEGAQRGGAHADARSGSRGPRPSNDDGTFKSADELREIYGGKGVTPDKR